MKSRLCTFPLFTVLRILFLLVKFAFMVALTLLWLRLSNKLPLVCHKYSTSMKGSITRPEAGFQFNIQNDMHWIVEEGH